MARSTWEPAATLCALKYGFSRREQDDFAVRSHTRARQAIAEGVFHDEIVPIEITLKGKTTAVVGRRRAGEV